MELCLRKFAEHYTDIFNDDDIEFLEKHGRLLFLSYLKPLINGEGFYHIESQFTDLRRMDIVVDYGREQFIIELKIWKGKQKEKEAYEQLCGYLNAKRVVTGYLLTFGAPLITVEKLVLLREQDCKPDKDWETYTFQVIDITGNGTGAETSRETDSD